MPLDPQRLARVRAHLLTAVALVTTGCGKAATPEHTINEPATVTSAPTPPPPTSTLTAPTTPEETINEPAPLNSARTPPPPAASTASPTASPTLNPAIKTPVIGPRPPVHLNTPSRPPKPDVPKHINIRRPDDGG